MTDEERELTKRWVETWKLAGPELEKQREAEVRKADTMRGFAAFRGLVLLNLRTHPPSPTSGLVEQQDWFRKLARKDAS